MTGPDIVDALQDLLYVLLLARGGVAFAAVRERRQSDLR